MTRWFSPGLAVVAGIALLVFSRPIDVGAHDATPFSLAALDDVTRSLRHGQAEYAPGRVEIRGVASAGADWANRLDTFRDTLEPGVELVTDVYVIDLSIPAVELCVRMFAGIPAEPVRFYESGTRMRLASYPSLDRVAEFARECPDTVLTITGHSDATGNESVNVRLSRARAQVVADYLVARGANPERLEVAGAGSANPIADNSSALGRERNRRIEFALGAGAPDQEPSGPSASNSSTSKTSVDPGGILPILRSP